MTINRGRYESPAHATGVIEHVMLVEGDLTVGPQADPVRLAPGDFIAFQADRPHLYESAAPVSRATLTVIYPIVASGPSAPTGAAAPTTPRA
jgi:uncharacterized cupin superfamily protein